MRLKKILSESRVAGIPFPFIAVNQNGDDVIDVRDLKAQQRRKAAVVKALQSRLAMREEDSSLQATSAVNEITGGFDPPPSTDNSQDELEQQSEQPHVTKADLLSIHKKAGELYNMISEDEEVEGWMKEKITQCMNDINSVHNALSYEKSKPMSVGTGDGAPADLARPTS